MRCCRSPWLAVAALSMVILPIAAAAAQGARPYVCMTRDFTKRVAYVSPIFAVQPGDVMKVNPAWNQIMTSRYGITALPSVSCQGPYPSVGVADTTRTKFINFIRGTMKQPLTELDWTYGGVPPLTFAAAPTNPTPAANTSPPEAPPTITAADRDAAQAELPTSKRICENNYDYRGLFDCDCFARMVLHHRLAHPEEWESDHGARRRPPVHDLAVGIPYKLDCTECLSDQHLAAWARQTVENGFSELVMSKRVTQARVDAFADCVAKSFPARFRANPYLDQYQAALNAARIACGKV